jgi:hypothetical protein
MAGKQSNQGIRMIGKIVGRTKKKFEDKTRYTYHVQFNHFTTLLYAWDDHEQLPLDKDFDVPVYPRIFNGKINWHLQSETEEETF